MTRYESGHKACMKRAIELAKIALSKGDIPVGSLIVRNDKILAEGIESSSTQPHDSMCRSRTASAKREAGKIERLPRCAESSTIEQHCSR